MTKREQVKTERVAVMDTKKELLEKLAILEKKESEEKEIKRKEENYQRFKDRAEDWMIGKAHADLDFINKKYSSERMKELLPISVSISGNCGETFRGEAPITHATHTYFRNVWNTDYKRNEEVFIEKLTEMVKKEVLKICRQLPVVLEMMGLQSDSYWITGEHFPKDKLTDIKNDVEKERAKILDRYKDKEFLDLIRKQSGWTSEDGTPVPEHLDVNLYHSRMILYRYIFKHRPTLQKRFKKTSFYESWKKDILA